MAGESAAESARRQREKAERLLQSSALYERGAEGERATATALATLPADAWTVLHDLKWPGRTYANIDHIVVGPPGVFVIDSKNWSGTVAVRNGVLRQNGYARETDVDSAARAASVVAPLVPLLRRDLVRPVLCFTRDEQLTGAVRQVLICSTANVVTLLTSRSPVLSPDEVRQLSSDIEKALRASPPAPSRSRRHSSAARRPSVARQHRKSPSNRRGKSRGWQLVRLLVVVGVVGVFLGVPEIRTELSDALTGLFVEDSTGPSGDGGDLGRRER